MECKLNEKKGIVVFLDTFNLISMECKYNMQRHIESEKRLLI